MCSGSRIHLLGQTLKLQQDASRRIAWMACQGRTRKDWGDRWKNWNGKSTCRWYGNTAFSLVYVTGPRREAQERPFLQFFLSVLNKMTIYPFFINYGFYWRPTLTQFNKDWHRGTGRYCNWANHSMCSKKETINTVGWWDSLSVCYFSNTKSISKCPPFAWNISVLGFHLRNNTGLYLYIL